jgi:pimeloyl-ACP methyl ester carboxylesterase
MKRERDDRLCSAPVIGVISDRVLGMPPVGFARRPDGRNIAYQVLGDADLDLVVVSGYATHLGLLWEDPSVAGFLHKLAAFSRLILLDRLGGGLSDRGPSGQSFEDDMDDVRLVLDSVGSERAAFFGTHLGGRLALLFAATYPERTKAVVTFASHPATVRDDDFPWGSSPEYRAQLLAALRDGSYDPTRMLFRVALTQEFLTGALPIPDPDRMLATVVGADRHRGLHPAGHRAGATDAGTACWSSTTRWSASSWPGSGAGRSRRPGTGS